MALMQRRRLPASPPKVQLKSGAPVDSRGQELCTPWLTTLGQAGTGPVGFAARRPSSVR